MTKEERADERKAYLENIAEVNEWKRKAQERRKNMTLEEKKAYFDAFAEELRTKYGMKLVFPE